MICRKCQGEGKIIIKKDYIYCNSCYLAYLNHKFRACIGKNKVISPNEKILVALSGGISSTALLDLIHTGISLNTHKKLRIAPQFVHLIGEDGDCNANSISKQCNSYGFDVQIYNISKYTSCYNILLSDLTTSRKTSIDFIRRVMQNVLGMVAKELKCSLIFTAESATNLAAKLLSDIVVGRGSQVENDIGFVDKRYENIKILRPLRDITKDELQYYIKIKGLDPVCNRKKYNNLQSVIDNFVSTFEKDSPATISTICKTADKIGSKDSNESEDTCVFCKGKMDMDAKKLTAIQAIIFSRMVSYRNKQYETQMEHMENADEEISDQSMLPFIYQHLCYCCSKNYAETDDPKLRQYVLGGRQNFYFLYYKGSKRACRSQKWRCRPCINVTKFDVACTKETISVVSPGVRILVDILVGSCFLRMESRELV